MECMGLAQSLARDDHKVGVGSIVVDNEPIPSVGGYALLAGHLPKVYHWVTGYDENGFQWMIG